MNTVSTTLLSAALALASLPPAQAAQVDVAHNSVKAGTSPLKVGSPAAPGSPIATGSKAKTQISLGDNGSLVRAGSKTEAVLQNETDLALRQGVMLASSGKRAFGREAVSVETPETKSTVKGTMLVAYQPKTYIKVTCIEGQVTVKMKAVMGEFVTLQAGEMVIINPAEKQLPQEVEVDLDELTRTCALLGPAFPELGATPRLTRAVDRQAKGIDQGDAVRTPLLLTGAGLEITLSDEQGVNALRRLPTDESASVSSSHFRRPPSHESSSSSSYTPPVIEPPIPPVGTGPEYIIDDTTQFTSSPSLQTKDFPLKQGATSPSNPTLWTFDNSSPTRTPELLIRGAVNLPSSSSAGDEFAAAGNLTVGDGNTNLVRTSGELGLLASQNVTLNSAQIATAPGAASNLILHGDQSVQIRNSTITQSGSIFVASPTINVSGSRLTGTNQGVDFIAQGQGAGISITNSSDLRSLATTAGIALQTQGAPIAIRNSQLNGGPFVLIDTMLPGNQTPDGLVEIENSTINADSIRARAFRSGGDRNALVVTGGSFNAINTIKFYAEGASKLVFRGDVRMNVSSSSGEAVFAGRTVQADNGANVNVNGNLRVFREVDNYNKPGFGNINATGQRSDGPFDARPNF